MEVQITIQDHKRTLQAQDFFTEELEKAFGHYPFISSCMMRNQVDDTTNAIHMSIELHVKQGSPIYVHTEGKEEKSALKDVMKKAKRKLEKYKDKHYRSSSNR